MIGCGKKNPQQADSATPKPAPTKAEPKTEEIFSRPVINPDLIPSGKVVLVNRNAKFAVLSYVTQLPSPGTRLNVYRDSLKVAELKITGPQRDLNTVADILLGDVRVGDEARED